MAGFAPTFEGGMGIEGAVQTPLSPAAGSTLSAASGLLGLFAAPSGGSGGSKDEINAGLWKRAMGDADLASASMEQLNQFQRQHPSAGAWAFDAADTLRNESLAERDVELSVEKQLDEAFFTSAPGALAAQQASAIEDPAAAQSYVANARAQYVANNFRTEELKREMDQYGANEERRTEMWTLAAFDLKAGANIINTAYTDAVEALVRDPTKTIAFDEIEGLVAELPQLAGTVMTRENAPQVLQQVRAAYEESQTQRIASARGLQPGELGLMPESVANSVFAEIDATIVWSERQLDPGEIKTRLENTTFNQMVEAGVPLDVISSISLATAGNPALQAAALGALTEGTGAVMELYNGAEFEAARKANRELSAADRRRAFAGFSELARVWGETSSVASVYEEVNETERALKFGAATIAALDTAMTDADVDGISAQLGQTFYRQNMEELAPNIDAAIAANTLFKPELVKHLSSDLNVQFLDVNQTANDQGYQVSVGDNDKLVFIPTEENLLEVQEIEAEIAALESGERGNPRDFRGMIDGYEKQLEVLQTPPELPLNDLQYKWTVLNGLGEVGSGVRQIASAEFGLELAADVATDTREALTRADSGEIPPTTARLLDKYEGGGDYNTLFGFSQRAGGQFEGIKVSEMTIGELKDFSGDRGEGSYGQWVKGKLGESGQEARIATPMGRYQFVGTTLADVASRMGLPDDTVFDEATQDAMFVFYAKDVMTGKSQSGKRVALRNAWEGLKNASDAEVDVMISEIESDTFVAGAPEVRTTEIEPAPDADPDAPTRLAPETSARPTARGGSGGSESAPTTSARPEARPMEQTATATEERPLFKGAAIPTVAATPAMDKNVMAFLESLGSSPDSTYTMGSVADVEAAQASGSLRPGDRVLITGEGKPYLVEVE